MLRMSYLARCNNRNVKAKVHPTAGSPEEWFNTQYFTNANYYPVSFDFFVNWTSKTVPNEIWIKRIVEEDFQNWPVTNGDLIENSIVQIESPYYLNYLRNFTQFNNLNGKYQLFRDLTRNEWANDPQEIVSFEIATNNVLLHTPSSIQNQIRQLRGSISNIGPGGLIYGTSSLECYLSTSPDFWPGDVDTLLVDENYNPVAVVEFKKHNLDSPIEEQTLLNYRNRDRLKYESLGLIRDRFDSDLPIFMIYYSTQLSNGPQNIKIEKISGIYNNLNVSDSYIIPMPDIRLNRSLQDFSTSFINML